MYSRIAILLLLVMIACIGVYVWAQEQSPNDIPDGAQWPPSPSELEKLLPPRLDPPPNVPSDVKVPEEPPIVCPPDKHRGPGPGGCVDGPPDMGVTEINGIPYAEAEAIYERHREELESIPGVIGAGLSAYGIIVTVSPDHWTIPTQVEGLLVITRPPPELRGLGHTESQTSRPLYGGVLFGTPQTEAPSSPRKDNLGASSLRIFSLFASKIHLVLQPRLFWVIVKKRLMN